MIKKYYHTLKYLKPSQTIGRFYSQVKKKISPSKVPEIPQQLIPDLKTRTGFLFHDPWNSREEILKGNYSFLNSKKSIKNLSDLNDPSIQLLWRFNFHYFNYLYLLSNEKQTQICIEWIKANSFGKGVGWHSYPLSLRLVNWVKAVPKNKEILKSIFEQSSFLNSNLEYYFPGNHYLENAKALYFAAKLFSDTPVAEQWLNRSKKIFLKELPVQVLSDGGYFERSPMYHAIMLSGFLDMYNITDKSDDFAEYLKEIITSMLRFQKDVTHPNGEISLFNDSTIEIAPGTKEILEYAEGLGFSVESKVSQYPETGYFIYKNKETYLIIDGGPVGPDYLPAHSHADIFSYELSYKGEKIITDTGVFEYQQGSKRDYLRSTAAHNTVCIDDTDQVECWDSFRLARRYKPENVLLEYNDEWYFSGEYAGYSKLIGDSIKHSRKVKIGNDGKRILFKDLISGKSEHNIKSRIHFIPGATVKYVEDRYMVKFKDISIEIVPPESAEHKVVETEYFPEFGYSLKRFSLVFEKEDALPVTLAYKIILI